MWLNCKGLKSDRLGHTLSLWLLLSLALCSGAVYGCRGQEGETEPMDAPLHDVASILGRPVEDLQVLDRRPLPLSFLGGQYEVFVLRDLTTGETLEVTLDLDSGRRVDAVELRRLDRERGKAAGLKLEPELLDVLLRHPDLQQVQVRLHFSLEPVRPPGGQADWSDVDVRQEFQALLDAELRELGFDGPLGVPSDSPVLEVTLSAPQIIKLGGSPLIQSIDMVAEPKVLDD